MPDEFENNDCTFGEDTGSSEACATCDVYEQCHAAFIGEGSTMVPEQVVWCATDAPSIRNFPEDRFTSFQQAFRNIDIDANHRIAIIPQSDVGRRFPVHVHWRDDNGYIETHDAPCSHQGCPICEAGNQPQRIVVDYETPPNPPVHQAMFRRILDRIEGHHTDMQPVEGVFIGDTVRDYVDVVTYDRALEPSEFGEVEAYISTNWMTDPTPFTGNEIQDYVDAMDANFADVVSQQRASQDAAVAYKELIFDCVMEGIYTKHELIERVRRELPEFCGDPINDDRICRLISDMAASDVTFEGKKIITLSDGALLFEGICPQGRKFGRDVDELPECETCEVYSTCAQRAIEIAGSDEGSMFD